MDYSILTETYEKLEATSPKLKKRDILSELLKKTPFHLLPHITLLAYGRVFPSWSQEETGVASKMMIRAIAKATGFKQKEIVEKFKRTGDLGLSAEECVKKKKQVSLLKKKLTVEKVFENIKKLASVTGIGSQERKLNLIAELLVSAKPKEGRYIVRTILGELRVGVAEGIVRDAIVYAFLFKERMSKEEKKKATEAVEYAWNVLSDFGEVAKIAKEKKIKGLKRVRVQLGKPVRVMLGLPAENIDKLVKDFGKVIAEYKYDGARVQCHKKEDKIWVYTRRLENVTNQFPDIVDFCRKGLKARECIVEGEALGINKKTGLPVPFQVLSQRIHRKYDIEKMVKEIPVQVNLFDIIYINGKMLFNKPLIERRKILEINIKPITKKFQLSKMIFTGDIKKLNKFYKEALKAKQEGLMLKIPKSSYVFGRHVETMYKIKEIMETLDLVVIGATWGEGARAKWITSFLLACRDPDTGKFLTCGRTSTGLKEEEYEKMTKKLKPLIIKEKGKNIEVKPKIVMEVAYQEIQKSPHYGSGFALRFPRFQTLRPEKGPEEADTLGRVKKLFESQGRTG